ncbi:glutamate-5-semialdehyde dehydrogenase [candidate division KSB1 bacterium]|nr:glutamate-5-semialdehyde dehydrogenase [candidate division KSB1 bacterium]
MKQDATLKELAIACKAAAKIMAQLDTNVKNDLLLAMADRLAADADVIRRENGADVRRAEENGLSEAMIDRLVIDTVRVRKMADALRHIAALRDPVGEITQTWSRPNGIEVAYQRIPLGVIAMIYESRPDVTSDAAGLCLKAGNAVFLRGGSEAFASNRAIVKAFHASLQEHDIPTAAITLVPTIDRAAIAEMLQLTDEIDLVIPRGGEGLIRFVAENSRIPVIKHYKGVCHQYVDFNADIDMAIDLLIDGKCSRPGVCNALETLLVHKDIAPSFFAQAAPVLAAKNVEIRACPISIRYFERAVPATEDDYDAEFLSLTLAVKVVDSMDEAIEHISTYGSDHTEVIVTRDYAHARKFTRRVNSAVVLVNASSRFSDGGELGLGAEIGISTTRLHAYGPMGLESLTTKKFVVRGDGQTRHNMNW